MIQPYAPDTFKDAVCNDTASKHMHFYELDYTRKGQPIDTAFIPCCTTEWIIGYNDSGNSHEFICVGSVEALTRLQLTPRDHYFGIRFDECGCYFNRGASPDTYPVNLFDRVISCTPEKGSDEFELIQEFLKARDFNERVDICLKFLTERKTYCAVPDRVLTINKTVKSCGSAATVSQISEKSGYSERHISRLYRNIYGFGAKDYIRILRFQGVLSAIIENPNQENSLYISGAHYSDQAHFQREFKSFMGETPKNFANSLMQ